MAPGELRGIFDEDALLYDQARPGYPDALVDDLFELAHLGPGAGIVEIGPGTGQATLPLVARGASVLALELGASLAAQLGRRTAGLPVDIAVGAFEDIALPRGRSDAVVAFTAWHWLTPGVRMQQAHDALRPGGCLATVTTEHVLGGTAQFFADAQRCYERWDPDTPPGLRLTPAEELPPWVDEVDTSELFAPAVRHRFTQDVTYSTRGYLDVLATYSGHRALSKERRRGLFACLERLIEGSYQGSVTKRYLYELRVARRQVPPAAATPPPGRVQGHPAGAAG